MISAFDGLFVPADLRAAVSPRAWLDAMLDAERALVNAGAIAGGVPAHVAAEIAAACDADRFDFERLAEEGRAVGNLAEPLARALAALVGDEAAPYVHRGATSQDIVDSAAMLVSRRALALVLREADRVAAATASLAREHRDTPMVARTLLQHAVPTTFGVKAAGWLTAVVEARTRLEQISRARLAAQLGERQARSRPTATAASRCSSCMPGSSISRFRRCPGTRTRTRVAELGAALAIAAGVAAKIAVDLVLLAQTEVAEVTEGHGTGRSSTMPHKQNPVGSTLARANARLATGHATVLLGSLEGEHERAAGAWQAEWPSLVGALAHTGGALHALAGALESLSVDAGRMRRNLDLTGGLVMAERISLALMDRLGRSEAQAVVRAAAARASGTGTSLADALLGDPRVGLDAAELEALLDPCTYLGCGGRARRPGACVLQLERAERGGGVMLHHRLDGPDGAPALMLCNSLGTTLEMWDPQADALAAQFRLVRYDQRGHGRSAVPAGPYSIEDWGATPSPCSMTSASSGPRSAACRSVGSSACGWHPRLRTGFTASSSAAPRRSCRRGSSGSSAPQRCGRTESRGWPRPFSRAGSLRPRRRRCASGSAPCSSRRPPRGMRAAARPWPRSICAPGSLRSRPRRSW